MTDRPLREDRVDPAASGEVCRAGFWGKLPALGDFVGRGLPADLVAAWDRAWQAALSQAGAGTARHEVRDRLTGLPAWAFVAWQPRAAAGAAALAWAGRVVPSHDRVGRPFPLLLALAWPQTPPWSAGGAQPHLAAVDALLPLIPGPDAVQQLAQGMSQCLGRRAPAGGPVDAAAAAEAWQGIPPRPAAAAAWWWPGGTGGAAPARVSTWPPTAGFIASHLLGGP